MHARSNDVLLGCRGDICQERRLLGTPQSTSSACLCGGCVVDCRVKRNSMQLLQSDGKSAVSLVMQAKPLLSGHSVSQRCSIAAWQQDLPGQWLGW